MVATNFHFILAFKAIIGIAKDKNCRAVLNREKVHIVNTIKLLEDYAQSLRVEFTPGLFKLFFIIDDSEVTYSKLDKYENIMSCLDSLKKWR
jgi:hypothetical protein